MVQVTAQFVIVDLVVWEIADPSHVTSISAHRIPQIDGKGLDGTARPR
jgi:hypothetical protein